MGLHVGRGLVVAEGRVVGEVEVLRAEFAADEDEGPADAEPAAVELGGSVGGVIAFDRLVHEVVVEADDVAADVDSHGHEGDALDGLAGEFEDGRLAVAGGTPEHGGAAAGEREADFGDDVAGEDELLEGAGEADGVGGADFGVAFEDAEVVLNGDGHGADILAAAEGVFGLAHAEFGEAVLPFGFEAAGGGGRFDEALAAEFVEGLAGDAGRDAHRVRDADGRGDGNAVEGLQGEVFDEALGEAQFVDVVGGLRKRGEARRWLGAWRGGCWRGSSAYSGCMARLPEVGGMGAPYHLPAWHRAPFGARALP
ncbi:hypothetical protein O0235_01000 [Tepidiforma flava]|uniref:Uncharacterized protein n=1 Tax=Tepidiforma flava TaxID=3004094 RepID=A0ABY7M889_9CHLR|nr:hypothetical protein [Tepidiforma flava]WBL36223.1 hypothetical protein O0235_01000 [Tepidiforma flava]